VSNENKYSIVLRFRFDHVSHSRAVITSADWDSNGLFVHKGVLELRPSSLKCDEPIRRHYYYYVAITRSTNGEVTLYLNGAKCASSKPKSSGGYKLDKDEMRFFHGPHGQNSGGYVKTLKVFGKTLSESQVAKECDCKAPKYLDTSCDNDKTVVVSPAHKEYKASSFWYGGPMGSVGSYPKLNSYDAWYARRNNRRQWLQIDTGKKQAIQGVVTQGRRRHNQWVKLYKVSVSNDGTTWQNVDCGRLFDGNKDRNTRVRQLFSKPIQARYIRIHPMRWHHHISMRAGVIICETKCKDKQLDFQMEDFMSETGGPGLDAPWGPGQFIGQVVDKRKDYRGYDMGRRWGYSKEECDAACKSDARCKGYVLGLWNNAGCWLKYEMTTNRREHRWVDSYFNVNTMWYNYKAPTGYKFNRNAGLQLNEKSCIKKGDEYTIIIEARPEDEWGRRRVLGSGGWGDKGAYIVNRRFEMYPSASGLSCKDYRISRQFFYKFGITRTKKGEVKLYINGYECASGKPSYADGYKLDTEDIQFFHDSNRHFSTWGYIRRIQTWGEALNATSMANASGCALPNMNVDSCGDKGSLFKATVKDIDFSGVRHRHDYGTGYGQGWDLEQKGYWISAIDDILSQWMQVDLGEVRTVTGVTTRGGDNGHHCKVNSYIVRTSEDGKLWTEVECGRIFYTEWKGYHSSANENIEKLFDKPIAARFVRLYPVTWHHHICLRMQVNTCPKAEKKEEKKEEKSKKIAPLTTLSLKHYADHEEEHKEEHPYHQEIEHTLASDARAERQDALREYKDEQKRLEARDERRDERLRELEQGVETKKPETLTEEISRLV